MWNVAGWLCVLMAAGTCAVEEVPRYGVFEAAFEATQSGEHPYLDVAASATLTDPDGRVAGRVALFWDGGRTWRLRVSPDKVGTWRWQVESSEPGLGAQSGRFEVVESKAKGGLRLMAGYPHHFARQDGTPFWFVGDTAWALFSTVAEEKLSRTTVEHYIDTRSAQGFNVVHSMLLSEAGQGNDGGAGFTDLEAERINPGYWQEVDRRLAYLNGKGITGGLVLAWADKGRNPGNWRDFPSQEARERYARYVAARYSGYDVYFIVAGEWNLELERSGLSRDALKAQYVAIGEALADADPHDRLIGIHPGGDGGVEEFHDAEWMSFGDYQQTYRNLHKSILQARDHDQPVVNSEYAYYLRDQNGDGLVDKQNSADLESIRHATWDIAMAGGYFITGFGTTYFGGNREPGPFDVDAGKNDDWERQVGHVGTLFGELEWWKLEPHDERVRAGQARGKDRNVTLRLGEKSNRVQAPPAATYWALAEPGRQYVLYVRGIEEEVALTTERGVEKLEFRQFDPREGRFDKLGKREAGDEFRYRPPDARDWVVVGRVVEGP